MSALPRLGSFTRPWSHLRGRQGALLTWLLWCTLAGTAWSQTTHVAAPVVDDGYIAGYAAAVLEQEFHLRKGRISVRDGKLTVVTDDVVGVERDQMIAALRRIRGVSQLEVLASNGAEPAVGSPMGSTMLGGAETTAEWFPRGHLFKPLHADPRWPHFAASVRRYANPGEGAVDTGFAGDFGETLALYRRQTGLGQWEFNVQAGAFTLFDIGRADRRLINTDYMVGGLLSYRLRSWSAFLRYYHQSSHLGDELLIRSGETIRRMNVSFEMLDAVVSYELWGVLRIFGGAGVLTRRDPALLAPYRLEYGLEYQHPTTLFAGVRPVAYTFFQTYREQRPRPSSDVFTTNVSVRAGLQFENLRILDRTLQLLFEYYNGDSPNGQFFTRPIETYGVGLHVYF